MPEDIPAGLYALSHRYGACSESPELGRFGRSLCGGFVDRACVALADCEQTTQVWNTCSNVLILDKNDTTPDQMMIPDGASGIDAIDRIMENLDQY